MTREAKDVVAVGKLVLAFARVERMTFHEDGVTPESDTDHTVMLSVCACALAKKWYPKLDVGLIAQLAIVHDLVEAYAGDTDSFAPSVSDREIKAEREAAALKRLEAEFGEGLSWIPATIKQFEVLDTPEARFVKTVDKVMPKITHLLNEGSTWKKRGYDRETMWKLYQEKTRPHEVAYASEFPEVVALIDELIAEVRIKVYGS
ncbi:HD domain-containing protein [Candidatus Nomurabacteria bacterium]|nr:HD domain-containing protein [Candidatus Nomurabacteria bacterium]